MPTNLIADHTLSSVTSSAVAVWLIEQLKRAKWFPLVQQRGTALMARSLSVFAAAAGTAGIQWQWTSTTHSLVVTGLTLSAAMLFAWHVVQHFALQEWIYQSAINKPQRTSPYSSDPGAPVIPSAAPPLSGHAGGSLTDPVRP